MGDDGRGCGAAVDHGTGGGGEPAYRGGGDEGEEGDELHGWGVVVRWRKMVYQQQTVMRTGVYEMCRVEVKRYILFPSISTQSITRG